MRKQTVFRVIALGLLVALFGAPVCTGWAQSDVPTGLVVGTTIPFSGSFFTELWGNNSADMDVRALIHGYATVAWTQEGQNAIDATVVRKTDITDRSGNRTYRFELNPDLTYNDGTPITAADYVFSVLFDASVALSVLSTVPPRTAHLVGYDAYRKHGAFTGVRLLGEHSFSLTIGRDYLPYFYELEMVNVQPYPMSVLAPGCEIKDDGDGAYIDGPFDAALLEKTVLDPANGYRFAPKLTCGPYALLSYDAEAGVATFEKNPRYLGNFEGQKPTIGRITFRVVQSGAMMEQLAQGELDLINKVSAASQVNAGTALVGEGKAQMLNYLRGGLSFLSFACERGKGVSVNLRKAIAKCVDEELISEQVFQGRALPVYGYYGLGQWMASENMDKLIGLSTYTLNLNGARELLTKDGWVLNADGSAYDEKIGGIRYRKDKAGVIEELVVRFARPDDSLAADAVERMLSENLPKAGIRVDSATLPFDELLRQYYRQTERAYDLYFTATNFDLVFDPYFTFHTGDAYQGTANTTGLRDAKLMQLADEMRQTKVNDKQAYVEKWLQFQQRFVELLPVIPLYSNIYYDFFAPDLQNYRINASWSWASTILYSYIGDPPVQEQGETVDIQ